MITHSGVGQFPGFNWIKQVILANVPIYLDNKKTQHYCQYNIEFVCQYWIAEQAQYFQHKTKRLAKHHHKLERIKSLLFIGSALMALALVLFKYQLMAIVIYQQVDAKVLTVLLMGLLPFLLGVWEIYQNKMAVKELLWQYQNQRSLFENALEHINHAKDIEHKYMVIQELADRALLENYIWIIHRFHREQEPPTAG